MLEPDPALDVVKRESFTIGWVCALDVEYVAARAMVDEKYEHDDLRDLMDHNEYTLGRIDRHNVVVAVCPDGGYGITSAAAVAHDIVRSFPNVRVALVVGVGGAIPSKKHDIRLGDVVVSSAAGSTAALVQYDLGKRLQDGAFQMTGQLNQPPQILRAAIIGVRSRHLECADNKLQSIIGDAISLMPVRARERFKRPNARTDVLFKPGYLHDDPGNDCNSRCPQTDENVVQRSCCRENGHNPEIHYGPIASANSVMKSAVTRDDLGTKYGFLCLEMEAAGIAQHIPCAVIRGMCDYADSHKNEIWHGYAALAAAAYAKTLLLFLKSTLVCKTATLEGLLSSHQHLNHVATSTLQMTDNLDKLVMAHHVQDWLHFEDTSSLHSRARGLHLPGTCQWLLDSPTFRSWKTAHKSFLALQGTAGVGKTLACSTAIEHLLSDEATRNRTVFFYFEFGARKTFGACLRSLLCQMHQKDRSLRDILQGAWESHDQGAVQPDAEKLFGCLQTMLDRLQDVWIVLDGLDEMNSEDMGSTQQTLCSFFDTLHRSRNHHLLISGRPDPDSEALLGRFIQPEYFVQIRDHHNRSDIER